MEPNKLVNDHNARVQATRRKVENARRRAREQAMRDVGLVKVKGALGRTFWE